MLDGNQATARLHASAWTAEPRASYSILQMFIETGEGASILRRCFLPRHAPGLAVRCRCTDHAQLAMIEVLGGILFFICPSLEVVKHGGWSLVTGRYRSVWPQL